MEYKLKSTKLYSFDEFQKNVDQHFYGVYIWGFKHPDLYNNKFLIYYVGRRYSSIKERIFEHREKHIRFDTHNIFKKEFLKDYFNIIWYKSDFGKKTEIQYEEYREKFAFLNADRFGRPINKNKKSLKEEDELKFNKEVQPHINFYTNNFYACCIPVNEIVESNTLTEKEKREIIDDLEKYVQELVPHNLSTKKIGKSKFNFNINFSLLEEDDFTSKSGYYSKMLNKNNGI